MLSSIEEKNAKTCNDAMNNIQPTNVCLTTSKGDNGSASETCFDISRPIINFQTLVEQNVSLFTERYIVISYRSNYRTVMYIYMYIDFPKSYVIKGIKKRK